MSVVSAPSRRGLPVWRRRLQRLAGASALLALSACATTPSPPLTAAAPASAPGAAPPAAPAPNPVKFADFIARFRQQAIAAGIAPAVYDRAMAGLTPNAHILALENQQPEFVRPIWVYLDTAVSPLRVHDGHQQLAANAAMLDTLQSRFGVPQQILVAIWGMETDYGAQMGTYNLFEALATLAYDGRRMAFGRRELLAALRLEQEQNFAPATMVSSWAGAFGQTQFMPTTFLAHAVDGNDDGRIDVWHSPADALASTANLLLADGWQKDQPWLREVTLPADFPYGQADLGNPQPIAHWQALGVRTALGRALPAGPDAAILLPAGAQGPAFLAYPNFKALLAYNNATAYALAVGELAQQIMGGPPILHSWPRAVQLLNRTQVQALQRDLKSLGYDPGAVDGLIGSHVRQAVRAYQHQHGLVADGFVTVQLFERIAQDAAAQTS